MPHPVDQPLPTLGSEAQEGLPEVSGGLGEGPLALPAIQSFLAPPAAPQSPAPLFQGPTPIQDNRSLPLTSRTRSDYPVGQAFQR